jgi:hypothetical protein
MVPAVKRSVRTGALTPSSDQEHSSMKRLFHAALAVAAAACSESDGSGKLTVQMTDAPFPFAEVSAVNVFVTRVDARSADVTAADAENSTSAGGWTTIATPNRLVNLLSLQGGVTTNLGTTELSTGTYSGFRLVIDPAQSGVILKTGEEVATQFPSAGQSGIKINLDQPIQVTEDSSVMILDFDVGKSFVMRGNSISQNGLIFKPVIRAVASEATGGVSGVVRADSPTGAGMAGVTVEVLKDGTPITSTDEADVVSTTQTDADGNFAIKWLLPGVYVVRATPPAATGYLPALLAGGLTVTSGATVEDQVIVVTK